jgi:hypothetical protein
MEKRELEWILHIATKFWPTDVTTVTILRFTNDVQITNSNAKVLGCRAVV